MIHVRAMIQMYLGLLPPESVSTLTRYTCCNRDNIENTNCARINWSQLLKVHEQFTANIIFIIYKHNIFRKV